MGRSQRRRAPNPRRPWTAVALLAMTLALLAAPLIVVTVLHMMGVDP